MFLLLIMISELAAMASGHKCCAPSQWEASGRLLSGTMVSDGDGGQPLAYRGLGTFNVSVDSENQRVASNNILIEGNVTWPFKLLMLYKSHHFLPAMYIIINNTVCLNSLLGEWKPPCIPDKATLVRRYYLGPDYEFPVYEYVYDLSENLTMDIGVTHDCIPTFQNVYGNYSGVDLMAFIHFHGYTSGIKDPDVFDVPDICDTQAMSNWNLQPETIENLLPGPLEVMTKHLQSTFSIT